ncbi:MAG: Kae1-associated serine/threonine protein kinase [Candidatus Aenigmarchaeota archaeon]|nr:Kae1-associated serine/threonine protein kinase [Candidatus Aenigmarchaeota archaeon]
MKLIAKGAEAKIYLDGDKIRKERICKNYREKELDIFLRKTRTKKEAKLLSDVKRLGIKVPTIFEVEQFCIEMEFIDGGIGKKEGKLKNILNKDNCEKFCAKVGEEVAKMHAGDIIHGDLTTSNLIVRGDELYFIDFGLGIEAKNLEQKAADLLTLHQNFKSIHPELDCWKYFLTGYKNEETEKVLGVFEKMLKRRRYV